MSLPWREFLEVVKIIGPPVHDVVDYALGKTDEKPPEWARVPAHLQSEIELHRLELRSQNGDSDPDVA